MSLRDKYQQAIAVAQQVPLHEATVQESGGRLIIRGKVDAEEGKRRVTEAVRSLPGWENEVVLEIEVREGAAQGASTYTVRAGDTLSGIAKSLLGDASAYREIFNANRDQLDDPDMIKPGQVLKIPQMARR